LGNLRRAQRAGLNLDPDASANIVHEWIIDV
jgi:hypothetical protein